MATLTGNTVSSTYESLIKVADNSTLNASTTELLSDGAGNNLPLKASQTTIEFTGNVNFNTATVQNLNTSDLTNDSGFITISSVNTATASLSASLAVDIASNLSAIESNDADILGLDNEVSLLQSTASFLVDSASLAIYNATNDFSQITFTKGDNTTIEIDTTPRRVVEDVKNKEAITLQKGTPVYASGSTGNAVHVYLADADDINKIPASFILDETLDSDEEGKALALGFINGVDTSGFTGGQTIYLAGGGGYTNVKPTGSAFIQRLGNVIKVDASNGSGVFTGAGDVNDLPNIAQNYLWIGDADGVPTAILSSSIIPTLSVSASYVAGANVDGVVGASTLAASALYATNADNIDIDNVSADTIYGFVFRDGDGSSYQQLYADSQADTPGWNPSTNTITAPIISASTAFSGDLDGNASTATTASYAITASYAENGGGGPAPVVNETTGITISDYTYNNKFIVIDSTGSVDIELDDISVWEPPVGTEIYFMSLGGDITIIPFDGTVVVPTGKSETTFGANSIAGIKCIIAGDPGTPTGATWAMFGDLA